MIMTTPTKEDIARIVAIVEELRIQRPYSGAGRVHRNHHRKLAERLYHEGIDTPDAIARRMAELFKLHPNLANF